MLLLQQRSAAAAVRARAQSGVPSATTGAQCGVPFQARSLALCDPQMRHLACEDTLIDIMLVWYLTNVLHARTAHDAVEMSQIALDLAWLD